MFIGTDRQRLEDMQTAADSFRQLAGQIERHIYQSERDASLHPVDAVGAGWLDPEASHTLLAFALHAARSAYDYNRGV